MTIESPADLARYAAAQGEIYSLFRSISSDSCQSPGIHPPLLCWRGGIIRGLHCFERAMQAEKPLALPVIWLEDDDPAAAVLAFLETENRPDSYSIEELNSLYSIIETLELETPSAQSAPAATDFSQKLNTFVQKKGDFRQHVMQYRKLPVVLRKAVAAGSFDLRSATVISGLPESVLELLVAAEISFSQRRIVAVQVQEICRRDSLAQDEIVSLVQRILAKADPQAEVQRLRFPQLTQRQERAHAMQKNHLSGQRIRIELPDNLEGDSISIVCRVASAKELHSQLECLDRLQEHIDEYLGLL